MCAFQTQYNLFLPVILQCCADGNRWRTCCRAAVQLLNEDSDDNRYFQRCRLEAQKEIQENAGIIIDIENQDQSDFHQAGDLADETGKACPYSRQDKVSIIASPVEKKRSYDVVR